MTLTWTATQITSEIAQNHAIVYFRDYTYGREEAEYPYIEMVVVFNKNSTALEQTVPANSYYTYFRVDQPASDFGIEFAGYGVIEWIDARNSTTIKLDYTDNIDLSDLLPNFFYESRSVKKVKVEEDNLVENPVVVIN